VVAQAATALGLTIPPSIMVRADGGDRVIRREFIEARLQGLAEPNMVVIAEGTRRLLGNLFELQDLGARDLKGIAGLIPPIPISCQYSKRWKL
jgi:hypothetical protein